MDPHRRVKYDHITSDGQLADLCRRLDDAPAIAFDTEFVSERSYRPQLCLVQIAAAGQLAVVDPLSISDMTPFWSVLADGDHETIVHAGREELLFSLRAIGRRPARLFDMQIAAGMVGHEYPAGYGSLVQKLLGQRVPKGETRTDWHKRPLTRQQTQYALVDVVHLEPMRNLLAARLAELDRQSWFADEMEAWQSDAADALSGERWRRVAKTSSLGRRGLAIVRELWQWREAEAERRDSPVRRILRDDLMIEIAKRASSDPARIRQTRGMDRGDLQRHLPRLADCVARANNLPENELPEHSPRDSVPPATLVCQFLFSALGSVCRSVEIAPSIVGTVNDVRELVAWHLGQWRPTDGRLPALETGWRADVVGNLFDELLDGKQAIRIVDPRSDHPLVFLPVEE